MTSLEQYAKKGLLKKQRPNFAQIKKQILRAQKDLQTYEVLLETDPEWAATVVYQAILRAGRALLYANGYLPADGRQHKTVVECTARLLGKEYENAAMHFERLRRRRNTFFYDSEDPGNKDEAKSAAKTAATLLAAIKEQISGLDPQLKLDV